MTAADIYPPTDREVDVEIDLTEPTPLQSLAIAYADRLAAIGAGAGPADLAALGARIAVLEEACFTAHSRHRRTTLADPSLYLG